MQIKTKFIFFYLFSIFLCLSLHAQNYLSHNLDINNQSVFVKTTTLKQFNELNEKNFIEELYFSIIDFDYEYFDRFKVNNKSNFELTLIDPVELLPIQIDYNDKTYICPKLRYNTQTKNIHSIELLQKKEHSPLTRLFQIHSTQFNKNNQPRLKVITESIHIDHYKDDLSKFIKGLVILSDYQKHETHPYKKIIKNFQLDKKGNFHWNNTREILYQKNQKKNQYFPSNVKETSYTYKENQHQNYALFNVEFNDDCTLESYDIIYNDDIDSLKNRSHYSIQLESFDMLGFAMKRTIRNFNLKDGQKQYTDGVELNILMDIFKRLQKITEITFDIAPEKEGLTQNERILKKNNITLYTHYNKDNLLESKTVIDLAYNEEAEMIFTSKRVINHEYNQKKHQKDTITFFKYNEQLKLKPSRIIEIDYLKIKDDHPLKINLRITDDILDKKFSEDIIEFDCEYIIEEATDGTLFLPESPKQKIIIKSVNDQGEIFLK